MDTLIKQVCLRLNGEPFWDEEGNKFWCSYTINSAGVYELTTVDDKGRRLNNNDIVEASKLFDDVLNEVINNETEQ